MPGIVTFLIALSIMLPAAFGIMLVHHNVLIQPDDFGVGMSVFALIGALMLLLRQSMRSIISSVPSDRAVKRTTLRTANAGERAASAGSQARGS